MVTFSNLDFFLVIIFFLIVLIIGFLPGKFKEEDAGDFLLSGRKVGLPLFVLTNVATWYGGILGVGEFTYRYGLLSWFTQGFPYYIFAILFALFFAGKIRKSSLFTIPDKIEEVYGRRAGLTSALIVFVLVLPAPYLLMLSTLLSLMFNFNFYTSILISLIISFVYLIKGGYKSDLFTDAFEFFVMFAGFILLFFVLVSHYGGLTFLKSNLPAEHLKLTGKANSLYVLVWFLIALWTFTDPGFHQRSYAAKNGKVAKYGILISVVFWGIFDFLTTSAGLFSRAIVKNLNNPVMAFPMLAEKTLSSGLKGLFYAAMFATILSTLNSYFFLSGTTLGNDFIFRFSSKKIKSKIPFYTKIGLIISAVISSLFVMFVQSIIQMWYLIGSICIPGMILLIIGAYYKAFRIPPKYAVVEILLGVIPSVIWFVLRSYFSSNQLLSSLEPMIVGLFFAFGFHLSVLFFKGKGTENLFA